MLLEEIYEGAPTVLTGTYRTTINELTDQRPALRAEVLAEAVNRLIRLGTFSGATKLLAEEDKGAILAGPVCLATRLPLAVARWYPYELPAGERDPVTVAEVSSEYFSGRLYLNGIEPGDRVVIIDDTVSTGGTLVALVEAVRRAGAEVTEALVVTEKPANGGARAVHTRCGVTVRPVLRIGIDPASGLVHVLSGDGTGAAAGPPPERTATGDPAASPERTATGDPAAGHTELCLLRHVVPAGAASVYAKCEFRNPTGSHKDRIFGYMIDVLERRGTIAPGWTLVECSTGNGGAALARVGLARGYRVVVLMPAGMTIERKTQIRAFGAEIIETGPDGFLLRAEHEAREYVRQHPRSYFLDQSTNPLNPGLADGGPGDRGGLAAAAPAGRRVRVQPWHRRHVLRHSGGAAGRIPRHGHDRGRGRRLRAAAGQTGPGTVRAPAAQSDGPGPGQDPAERARRPDR